MPVFGVSRLPALPDTRISTGTPAESVIVELLAGAVRWLAEYASGTIDGGTDQQCAPPTPIFGYTKPGHDHSGGLMGRPQQHTVWSASFGWVAESAIENKDAPSAVIAAPAATVGAQLAQAFVRNLWIPGGKVYNLLQFEVLLRNDIAPGSVSTDAVYTLRVVSPVGTEHTATGTITASTSAYVTINNIPFQPGRLQAFEFYLHINNPATETRVYLIAAALHQTRLAA